MNSTNDVGSVRARIAATVVLSVIAAALAYLLDGARLAAFGVVPVVAVNLIRRDLGIVWESSKGKVTVFYVSSVVWMLLVAYYIGVVPRGQFAGAWAWAW